MKEEVINMKNLSTNASLANLTTLIHEILGFVFVTIHDTWTLVEFQQKFRLIQFDFLNL